MLHKPTPKTNATAEVKWLHNPFRPVDLEAGWIHGGHINPPPQFGGRIWPNLPNWSAELFVTSGIHDVCAPKIFSLNFLFCR